jgi:hypothetical protein
MQKIPGFLWIAHGRWSQGRFSCRLEEGSVMKVTFGVLPGYGAKMPQMFVVPLLFNHYSVMPRGAMRAQEHSVFTVYGPGRAMRRLILQ